MEAGKRQIAASSTNKNDLTTRRKSDFLSTTERVIVSFEDNANANDRTNHQDKIRNHSQGSLAKGLEVVVPSKLKSTNNQQVVSFDKNSISSPHMVSNSYILTASEDENEPDTVDSGGYFSTAQTRGTSSRKFSYERRGTVNTINTIDDDDEEEQKYHTNFTHDAFDKYYRRKIWFLILIRACCIASVVSVCMNTPQTFKKHLWLRNLTLGIDIVTGFVLGCEAVIKILHKGFIRGKKSYLRSGGRIFELIMVLCIFISIAIQAFEMTLKIEEIEAKVNNEYLKYSFIRALRPLLLLRVMKSMLNLSLPKTVSYRSMKQIWGVFLFTCYFVILASLLGIQMFGLLNFYCIKDDADSKNITQTDLLIPSTRCPPKGYESNGFACPTGFKCVNLQFKKFYSDKRPYEHILAGLLTVYEASSMEGWSSIMYAAIDTRFFVFATLYSLALIVFISILVKNVFIAIITEAFADLRLQVSSHNTTQPKDTGDDFKVLRRSEDHLSLINRNEDLRQNYARQVIARLTRNWAFQFFILLCVFADAIIQSFFYRNKFSKYVQIGFTLLFLLETILKVIGLGRRQYFQSSQNVFEFIISVGSTLFLAPVFLDHAEFVVFQVMRPFRLLLLWSTLRSFLKRILGSGRKIGSLILFTMAALVIAAGISLQLFCGTGLPEDDEPYHFATFPRAIKSLFQIFMTEAWGEIMSDVVYRGGFGFAFLVFILFILFHFLAATILISVFVALILDNLELEEDVKIAKQRRLGEEVADTHEKLPARMRLYQNLKPRPKLTKIDYVETTLPKLRQSFVSNYVDLGDDIDEEMPVITSSSLRYNKLSDPSSSEALPMNFIENQPMESSSLHQFRKQSSVSTLMQDALNKRMSISHHGTNGNLNKRQKTMTKSVRRGLTRHVTGPSSSRKSRDSAPPTPVSRVLSNQSATRKTFNQNRKISSNSNADRSKDIDVGLVRQKLEEAQRKKDLQIEQIRENHPLFDKSLFIFSTKSPIRQFVHKIVYTRYNTQQKENSGHEGGFSPERLKRYFASQTWLDWAMLFFTQVSIIAMAWETPSYRTFDDKALMVIEYIFVVTTSIELILKIISDGLILSPNAFIRDFGNTIHVVIYIVSLIYIAWKPATIPAGSVAQVLLVLRALRPLRLITLAPPLRKVMTVLLSGYKAIIKVAILQFALMFVFASYGVQYLGDKLYKCNDEKIKIKHNCTGVFRMKIAQPNDFTNLQGRQIEILVPRVWRNPRSFNFDNMGNALLALLEILSLEGWTEVRDIIEDELGFFGSLYPHVYVFFASLIGLTLFIGVIVSNFNENKGTALLTVEQKRWKDLKKKLLLAQPLHLPSRPPVNTLRHKLFDIFIGKMYNRCYGILILVNCSTLWAGQWVPTERDYIEPLTYVAIACCLLFTIDTLLKIYIFQWSGYWLSWRNRFDFMLMVCGLIFTLWNLSSCHGDSKDYNSCNVSKQFGVAVFILRFVSLSGKHNILRMLMLTVVISLTKSFFTIAVLVCIILCYAFVGVIVFGSVKPGLAINRNVNFNTSYYAIMLLFRVATGEDWNKIMHDAMLTKPYCTEKPDQDYWLSNCGSPVFALIYFHSYYLIISYIFLNLFIAVVIENFSIFYSTDDDPIMSQQDIQCFQETWNLCDEEKSGSMTLVRARVVLRLLRGGLAMDKLKIGRPLIFRRMVAELEKVKKQKKVTFHNLLFVIAFNKIDISSSLQLDERLAREELEMAILEEVATETIREWITMIAAKLRDSKKPKSKLERRLSGISSHSLHSIDSINSDVPDEMNTSTLSLSSHAALSGTQFSPGSSFEASASRYDPLPSMLRQRQAKSSDEPKEDRPSDFYSWWEENLAKNKVL